MPKKKLPKPKDSTSPVRVVKTLSVTTTVYASLHQTPHEAAHH
jgi:hypothetical protein